MGPPSRHGRGASPDPEGAYRTEGLGRELDRGGVSAFTETKNVFIWTEG
jgi:hypothetical protein